MKKILILFLLIFPLFITGCKEKKQEKITSLNITQSINNINVYKDYSTKLNGDVINIKEKDQINDLVININKLEINEISNDELVLENILYYIELDNLKVYFKDQKTVYYNDKKYEVVNGNIDFLNNLFKEEILTFNDFSLSGDIIVKDQKNSKEVTISDEDNFVNLLKNISFKKTNKKELDVNYIIKYGNTSINIEGEIFQFNENYYQVVSGSFDFLKELKYESSGWLPWV